MRSSIVLSVGTGGTTVTQVAQRHDVTRQQDDGVQLAGLDERGHACSGAAALIPASSWWSPRRCLMRRPARALRAFAFNHSAALTRARAEIGAHLDTTCGASIEVESWRLSPANDGAAWHESTSRRLVSVRVSVRTPEKQQARASPGPCSAGAPDWIRTSDLCLRRAALYPAELRVPAAFYSRAGAASQAGFGALGGAGSVPLWCPRRGAWEPGKSPGVGNGDRDDGGGSG